jgi:lipoyl(octanoyl) transferase
MEKEKIIFKDLGLMDYQAAWDYQEKLLQENVRRKSEVRSRMSESLSNVNESSYSLLTTQHYLLFTEHPLVYTLGKSGNKENVLLDDDEMKEKDIQFFNTNRGGDITFHGPGQIVGYPILDLEKFYTDIGKYPYPC